MYFWEADPNFVDDSIELAELWWLHLYEKSKWPATGDGCAVLSVTIETQDVPKLNLHDRANRSALIKYAKEFEKSYGKRLTAERRCRVLDDFIASLEKKSGYSIGLVRAIDRTPATKRNSWLYINECYPCVVVRDHSLISCITRER